MANAIIGSAKKVLRTGGRSPEHCSVREQFDALLAPARSFITDELQRAECERALAAVLGIEVAEARRRDPPGVN